ncbi:hypothetical protein HX866_25950 [Pseudomonas gingeri]|uniref:hypothetical protein n=1 Tax=Pseudomonas gingeri TaxID=117681 RepID=UPI0015A29076|nr:hypothetical protein [Pseudomonas gingeri]NWA28342.1 hypothetical protein [Pseudomonas gingeri]
MPFFEVNRIPTVPPRRYTEAEFDELVTGVDGFPNLRRENCWFIREGGRDNEDCIHYSVGKLNEAWDAHEWRHRIEDAVAWCEAQGYEQVDAGSEEAVIDLWVTGRGNFAHATKKYEGPFLSAGMLGLWVSFPRPGDTFTHRRFEILNTTYTRVGASLKKRLPVPHRGGTK